MTGEAFSVAFALRVSGDSKRLQVTARY